MILIISVWAGEDCSDDFNHCSEKQPCSQFSSTSCVDSKAVNASATLQHSTCGPCITGYEGSGYKIPTDGSTTCKGMYLNNMVL